MILLENYTRLDRADVNILLKDARIVDMPNSLTEARARPNIKGGPAYNDDPVL